MIKNLVFDMGNVLLYWNPMVPCRRYAHGDEALAQKLCDAAFRHPNWCGKVDTGILTEEEYTPEVVDRMDTPAEKALAARLMEDYDLDATFPIPESEKLVKDALEAGYRLYILSNASAKLHHYLYKIPCLDRFSGIVISAEEKLVKPDLRIFETLEKRYQLLPEEILFVDDLPVNVQGALNAGWQGFVYNVQNVGELRKLLGL